MSPQILVPYDKREAMTLREAAKLYARSESTIRTLCQRHDVGRRVAGGPWCVSRVAIAMLFDGDVKPLAALPCWRSAWAARHAVSRHAVL